MIFKDRREAGRKLAPKLEKFRSKLDVIVLGLPRGGVVIASEIVKVLDLPMDLIVPRKIGAPGNPEFAIGAIAEDGEGIFNEDIIASYGISQGYIDKEIKKERIEAQRRLKTYRGDRSPLNLEGKIAILVDDGIATGLTMQAAIKSAKAKRAKKIIVAIPVTARDSLRMISDEVDEVIYLYAPVFFGAIGSFYEIFSQTEDEEVIAIMKKAKP